MNRRILILLLPALVGTMVGVGYPGKQTGSAAGAPAPPPAMAAPHPRPTSGPDPAPRPEPTDVPTPQPVATAEPGPTADPGTDESPAVDVLAVQRRLAEQRYYVGALDGRAGPGTRSAVMAFQKVHGLVADGVVGPATLAALEDPRSPALRGGPATRIEVDLTKQVLYLVEDGRLTRVLPVSSGSGETYRTAGGGTARSLTPVGTFRIERRIRGERRAPLGTLYDPLYFHRGWAIHGSSSVPAHPASHGCVRVTRPDAVWLADRVADGTAVILYGGTHTFARGSTAAGTDAPAGDPGAPAPAPVPAPAPAPQPKASPTAQPAPAQPSPSPTQPAPTPAPSPTPTPGPTGGPSPAPAWTPLPAA